MNHYSDNRKKIIMRNVVPRSFRFPVMDFQNYWMVVFAMVLGVILNLSTLEAQCTLTCPAPDTISTAANTCGVMFNVPPPTVSGNCMSTPPGISQFFPVGTTTITYSTTDAGGNSVTCNTTLTVIDDEDPFVAGVQNLTYDLGPGECTYTIPQTFSITENCIDPAVRMSQMNNPFVFDEGYHCDGGPTKYLRVYDADDYGINTELVIEDVEIGVESALNSPQVIVNIYRLTGVLDYSNMELIGNGMKILSPTGNTNVSIPVSATIAPGEMFVVEVVVPGSQFNGVVMAMNNAGESAPTYVVSEFCGITTPTLLDDVGFAGYGALITVNGHESSYVLRPIGSGIQVGDAVGSGVHTVDYEVEDASGNISNISFTVTVNEFPDAISAIACNDEVQVSLDNEECTAVITADQILEGGPYGCFDDYVVNVYDQNGFSYGDVMTYDNVGMNLTVQVTGPNGNSCWSKVVVQDKAPPELDCMDIYTTCYGDLDPGSPIAEMVTFESQFSPTQAIINGDVAQSYHFDVPVFGLFKSTITNVAVRLNIEHEYVSELSATITSPDGMTATLFISPGTDCEFDNINITLDDNALATYAELETMCSDMEPAISGAFQPAQSLSIFNGKDPNGDWTITINDHAAGNGGKVISAEIIISQTGGIVGFPTDKDVIFQTEGDNQYTLMGLDPCGPVLIGYNDVVEDQDCSSPYSQIIKRQWVATDQSGNASQSCIQTIYVYRNGLSTLMFPPNYDGIQENTLSCGDYGDVDAPPVSVTGEPFGNLCDNVQVFPPEDTRIEICDNSYKIIRHWKLLEWCSGEVVEHNQIIKVLDDEPPVVTCSMDDLEVSADPFSCTGTWHVPDPTVIYDCNSTTYTVSYLEADPFGNPPVDGIYIDDNVVTNQDGSYTIKNLPFGRTWVKFTVTDACGNSTDCFTEVDVIDDVPPVAVCDEHTVVSVGADGNVEVMAQTFDDGSHDNCGIDKILARKMTNACANGNTSFGEKVVFCCEEVGETIMVAFEVTDYYGNQNTCMVEVEVQDKLPPYITKCPDDITLNCHADYEDLAVTGEPVYIDNCEVVSINFVDNGNINQCGEGIILRTWTVKDKQGFKASCVQRIHLIDDDPFVEQDITWPKDYFATTCNTGLDPDDLSTQYAYPQFDDDNCSLVASSYKDTKFTIVDDACVKILRKWTVIDWCTYDENNPQPGYGLYEHVQVIKLLNSEAPEFTNCNSQTIEVFGECKGNVDLSVEAIDDCTPEDELVFTYQIDLFGDGIDATDFHLNGTDNSIHRNLPIGNHMVHWTVEDRCGNITYCDMPLKVIDGKKPTPYCNSSITTVVMNSNGMVEVWASDFDLGSFDNCTPKEDLIISFSSNTNDLSRIFSCEMIPNGISQAIQVEMWVTDEQGNQDFCSISLILQDSNADVCPDNALSACDCTPQDHTGWAVATCNAEEDSDGIVGIIYDIRNTPSAPQGENWSNSISSVHPANWTIDEIGQIFGIAIDGDENIYLAASDVYDTQFDSDPYGPGQIFKARPENGFLAEPFVVLPNSGGALNGVGGIVWSNSTQMLYASNLEDGKLYRINANGTIMETFDPWTEDTGGEGIVSPAEQVWGIGLNQENDQQKLYFARISDSERSMYSITLNADGSFPELGSEVKEFSNIMGVGKRITDIEFNSVGNQMIFAERGTKFTTGAHDAKVLRYDLSGSGWSMALKYFVGGYVTDDYPDIPATTGENSGGGVAFGNTMVTSSSIIGCDELVWSSVNYFESGDFLLYGMQGMDANGNTEDNTQDIIIDYDGNLFDFNQKGDLGDVEIFKCSAGNATKYEVNGKVKTHQGDEMEGLSVKINSNQVEYPRSNNTDDFGNYRFDNLDGGHTYQITGERNDDVRNGVSTLDLVKIQRHILELESFSSPYLIVASDINNDGKVKVSDLVALRKVILGIVNDFPNGQKSWRFIPKNFQFSNTANPFPYEDKINIANLTSSMTDMDMTAIKIGDVNGNANPGLHSTSFSEARGDMEINLEVQYLEKENTTEIPFYLQDTKTVLGMQFALKLENGEVSDIISGQMDVNDDMVVFTNEGMRLSWTAPEGKVLNRDEPLFTIVVEGHDHVLLDSHTLSAEMYDANGTIYGIGIENRESTDHANNDFVLYQNSPNPFKESTSIEFFAPRMADVRLVIRDITGRVVFDQIKNYQRGNHKIAIDNLGNISSGVLYYTLTADGFTATKRMINVR